MRLSKIISSYRSISLQILDMAVNKTMMISFQNANVRHSLRTTCMRKSKRKSINKTNSIPITGNIMKKPIHSSARINSAFTSNIIQCAQIKSVSKENLKSMNVKTVRDVHFVHLAQKLKKEITEKSW